MTEATLCGSSTEAERRMHVYVHAAGVDTNISRNLMLACASCLDHGAHLQNGALWLLAASVHDGVCDDGHTHDQHSTIRVEQGQEFWSQERTEPLAAMVGCVPVASGRATDSVPAIRDVHGISVEAMEEQAMGPRQLVAQHRPWGGCSHMLLLRFHSPDCGGSRSDRPSDQSGCSMAVTPGSQAECLYLYR